jgi:hypothetical protein
MLVAHITYIPMEFFGSCRSIDVVKTNRLDSESLFVKFMDFFVHSVASHCQFSNNILPGYRKQNIGPI